MSQKTLEGKTGSGRAVPSRFGAGTRALRSGAFVMLAAALAACSTAPEDPVEREIHLQTNDPAEPANRYVFDVDMAAVDMALAPIAGIYAGAVPEPYREGVGNILDNLTMPVTALNSALQGDVDNAVDASVSFFINSTAGLGGLFDIPGSFGDEPREEDFGQTLAVWGVAEGPYVVLPLAGPSTARDTLGLGVDILTDPMTYLLSPVLSYTVTGVEAVHDQSERQARQEELRKTSIDFYAAVRSLYRQSRDSDIANGEADPFWFEEEN